MAKKRRKKDVKEQEAKTEFVKHRGLSCLADWPFTFDTPTPPKVKKSGDVALFIAGLFFIGAGVFSLAMLVWWL